MRVNSSLFFSSCQKSLFIIILVLLGWSGVFAQEVQRIVVIPFVIHTADDERILEEEVYKEIVSTLSRSRLVRIIDRERILPLIGRRQVSESVALAVARQLGGDLAIMGSFTEIGESNSLDVNIIDVRQGRSVGSHYFLGRRSEGITPLAQKLQTAILGIVEVGQRIVNVEIKGNRKIDSQAIMQVLKSTPGGVLSEVRISEDIKAIYKMGFFSHVEVKATTTPAGRVITFEVEEKPMITEVVIEGNRAVKKGDIEEVMSVKTRQVLSGEKLKEDVEKIRELYGKKGYLNVEIVDRVERDGENNARIIISIKEGAKIYIRKIIFAGNRVYAARTLKKLMSTKERWFLSFLTDAGILNNEQLKQDVQKINAFYLNNGFINAQVGDPVITYEEDGIHLSIPIFEGNQFKVGKVDISGDHLSIAREELMGKLTLPKMTYYNRGAVIKDIEILTQACNDEGYAYADVSPQVSVLEKELKVDIVYHIEKGQQVYLHRIGIIGNTKTRDKVIRRQLALAEGDLFSSSKLKASFMALNRLRYFEEIDFQSERGPADNLTDLNIHVKEKPTGMFSIGAGYSAVDHAVFTAQISQQNLFGRGQILSLKASLSGAASVYDISFIEPWLFDIPLWSRFDVWNTSRDYDYYHLATSGFGVTFGYPIYKAVSGSISYRFTVNEINEVKDNAAQYIKDQEGKTVANALGWALARDTTDDHIFPSRGSRNSIAMDYVGGFLGGDVSFNRYLLTSSWFYPMGWGTNVSLRGRLGYIEGTRGKAVPIYERFFLGGMNSLRGLRSIGPVDEATGDVLGGLTMFNANLEFLFPLLKDAGMKGVIFYDTGNAWLSGYHLSDLRHTAGFGVRWYSPIGPLRLEWGYVLDRREGESASRWEFTIGMFM